MFPSVLSTWEGQESPPRRTSKILDHITGITQGRGATTLGHRLESRDFTRTVSPGRNTHTVQGIGPDPVLPTLLPFHPQMPPCRHFFPKAPPVLKLIPAPALPSPWETLFQALLCQAMSLRRAIPVPQQTDLSAGEDLAWLPTARQVVQK